jgi:hypothetical protein
LPYLDRVPRTAQLHDGRIVSMSFPLQGGCLCGAVRYEISQPPDRVYACHCHDCQRAGGGAFSIGVAVPAGAFRVLSGVFRGRDRVTDSGRVRTSWLCAQCGVWICGGSDPSQPTTEPLRVVRGGTLDDTAWVRPTIHYFARSKQGWVVLPEGATVHETQDV